MTSKRWWDVAITGALVLMAIIVALDSEIGSGNRIGAVATLAVIGIFYALYGRRAIGTETGGGTATMPGTQSLHGDPIASVALRAMLIIGCGVATAFSPTMATVQALVFPLLWVLTDRFRGALLLSGALAVSVGIGMFISLGGTADALYQAALIEAISFIFALALGTWITRIAHEGEKHRVLLEELRATQGELAAMYREAGSTSERERLARDIHDTIAQSLTSMVMLAQRSRSELARIASDTSSIEASVDLIETTARDALTEARSLVASMSAVRSATEDSSLAETIARLAERFGRETGIQVDVAVRDWGAEAEPAGTALDRELEVVLLRCAQEGLANVRKHSRASLACVSISRAVDAVTLEVSDNGRGLGDYSATTETGFGLAGMRDRVNLVGGHLEVTGGEPSGTLLRITVPAAPGGDT